MQKWHALAWIPNEWPWAMLLHPRSLRTNLKSRLIIITILRTMTQRSSPSSSTPPSPQTGPSLSSGLTADPRPLTSHIHRLSGIAPPDAPSMTIRYHRGEDWCRWFYATDVPKRKLIPDLNEKPKTPSKWSAFAPRDSKALENEFQKMISNPKEPTKAVPVNEDHLFEVDIVERELKPVYFRGSTYEVCL
jgi:hypothetical protein